MVKSIRIALSCVIALVIAYDVTIGTPVIFFTASCDPSASDTLGWLFAMGWPVFLFATFAVAGIALFVMLKCWKNRTQPKDLWRIAVVLLLAVAYLIFASEFQTIYRSIDDACHAPDSTPVE